MTFNPDAQMRRHWLEWGWGLRGQQGLVRWYSGTGLGFALDLKHDRQPSESLKESGNKMC